MIVVLDDCTLFSFLRHIPQYSPQDLTRCALWDFINNFDFLDPFVPHFLLLHVLDQRLPYTLRIVPLVLLNYNVSLGAFTGIVVRNTEDSYVLDTRVAKKKIFQLGGSNLGTVRHNSVDTDTKCSYLLALDLDQFFGTIHDGDQSLFVDLANISSV